MKTPAYAAMSLLSPYLKQVLTHTLILFPPPSASHKLLPVFLFQSYIYMLSIYDSLGWEEYVEAIVLVLD